MRERVKAAAVQIAPVYMNKKATLEKVCQSIEEAGRQGAELLVFPETLIPGYPYWRGLYPIARWSELMVAYQKNAVRVGSEDTELLCRAAKQAGVFCAVGCTELSDRLGSETLYNTILFIDPEGRLLGRHRKLMPTHGERMVWGMGDAQDLRVFETALGRVGGLVCFEHHITLLKAAMACKGEEIHCAVWPGWWYQEGHPGNKRRWRQGDPVEVCDQLHAIREYAFETQSFVVSASQYIPDEALPEEAKGFNIAAGGSAIVNPAGLVLAGPVLDREEILYAVLEADDRRAMKAYFDSMGHYARWDVVRLDLREEGWKPTVR